MNTERTISPETYAEVFLEYRAMLFRFIVRIVENRELAKDMVMDAFVRALERNRFNERQHLVHFLFLTARHKAITYLHNRAGRTISMETVPEQVEESFINELVRYETVKELYKKMEQLPAQRRRVMTLLYKEGLNPPEVSQTMNIPPVMVKVIKSQALKQLKELINGKK